MHSGPTRRDATDSWKVFPVTVFGVDVWSEKPSSVLPIVTHAECVVVDAMAKTDRSEHLQSESKAAVLEYCPGTTEPELSFLRARSASFDDCTGQTDYMKSSGCWGTKARTIPADGLFGSACEVTSAESMQGPLCPETHIRSCAARTSESAFG